MSESEFKVITIPHEDMDSLNEEQSLCLLEIDRLRLPTGYDFILVVFERDKMVGHATGSRYSIMVNNPDSFIVITSIKVANAWHLWTVTEKIAKALLDVDFTGVIVCTDNSAWGGALNERCQEELNDKFNKDNTATWRVRSGLRPDNSIEEQEWLG